MNLLRKILFPFAIVYDFITRTRNFLYNHNIFTSHSVAIPSIAVGNLSVGGTGKTPQIEYLIRLLQDKYHLATLSRGYKRTSKGFVLANTNDTASTLGDEPFQFFQKFPKIKVAVHANRVEGIQRLLAIPNPPEVILLDDAFQHRKVNAGFYILLTTYSDLYSDDFLLPTGNLRESKIGAQRANLIVVTKCPSDMEPAEQHLIAQKLKVAPIQKLFFSKIAFDDFVYQSGNKLPVSDLDRNDLMLVAGIAKPDSFFRFFGANSANCMTFPDHHNFSPQDVALLLQNANGRKIITTEKDYVRLAPLLNSNQLFYLPIKSAFLKDEDLFNQIIVNYVGESSRNSSIHSN